MVAHTDQEPIASFCDGQNPQIQTGSKLKIATEWPQPDSRVRMRFSNRILEA